MSKLVRGIAVGTTTPVKIIDADGPQSKTFRVQVRSGGTITFGDENVIAGQGPQLATGTPPPTIDLTVVDDDVFALATGSAAVVDVLSWVSMSVT